MNLYKVSQDENVDYDTYDSMIVAAENEADAASIHPDEGKEWSPKDMWTRKYRTWTSSPMNVEVKYIGTAADDIGRGVVLASFNAG
jgi:hypothetical protein